MIGLLGPLILWCIGLVLVAIEFYIPGMIMGIAGGILLLISIIIFSNEIQSAPLTILYTIAVSMSVVYIIKFTLSRIKKAKPQFSIYSDKDQAGYIASAYDHTAIGKEGVVLSDLKPGGYISIDGIQHQAISINGYLPRGSVVLVIGGEEESLIVKHIKKDS